MEAPSHCNGAVFAIDVGISATYGLGSVDAGGAGLPTDWFCIRYAGGGSGQ